MKSNSINEYRRVIGSIQLNNQAKERIARNCARYSTLKKIKSGRFAVIAVKSKETTDRI